MKANKVGFVLLTFSFGCRPVTNQEDESDPKLNSVYELEVARYSNSTVNPYNWGASPQTVTTWAKKVGWESGTPPGFTSPRPLLSQLTYWIRKGEGDHKQMLTFTFSQNKLQSISVIVVGNMDKAYRRVLNYNCSETKDAYWECLSCNTVCQREESSGYTSAFYTFMDSRALKL